MASKLDSRQTWWRGYEIVCRSTLKFGLQGKDYKHNDRTRSHLILLFVTACLISQVSCRETSSPQLESRSVFERQKRQVSSVRDGNRDRSEVWLEPPFAYSQVVASNDGPAIDLVGINRRQHELHHQHNSKAGEKQTRWSEFVQSNIASMPDRIIQSLPNDVTKQVLATVESDSSFLLGSGNEASVVDEDPDSASIERLTKSCLTIHASSATPEQLNVTFHLYTRKNPKQAFILRPQVSRAEMLALSPIDFSKPIKWVTHGFHTDVDRSEWMPKIKDKILANEDANVILTDWRRGASPALAFYPKAAANAHIVAKMIVKILRRIRDDINFLQLHLIGHSLGAHIMGFVGSAFTEEYLSRKQQQVSVGNKSSFWRELGSEYHNRLARSKDMQLVGRITACDPALPCFGPQSSAPNSQLSRTSQVIIPELRPVYTQSRSISRQSLAANSVQEISASTTPVPPIDWTPSMWTHLRPDSAIIVEVMHSNPGVMGYADPLGDFDFYPNGFDRQPGCDGTQVSSSTATLRNFNQPRGRGLLKRQMFNAMLGTFNRRATNDIKPREASVQSSSGIVSTLEKFLKPIRDFFHGNTCSHHRSVEYMVESIYYENVPQDRKLDRDYVCQLVGYRCRDYGDFKKGFCFRCHNSLDCRAFGMQSASPISANPVNQGSPRSISSLKMRSLGDSYVALITAYARNKFGESRQRDVYSDSEQLNQESNARNSIKRALPTLNPYTMDYRPPNRNKYFFDTRPAPNFCLHHYHVYVKYRWFRIRDSVTVTGFKLIGSLGSVSSTSKVAFNRYNYQSYTALFTHTSFLGPIHAFLIFGENMRPKLIEYVEISYMSNLDPNVRSLGSAKLCIVRPDESSGTFNELLTDLEEDWPANVKQDSPMNMFVRCSSRLV